MFKVFPEMLNQKQENGTSGFLVSLLDPLNYTGFWELNENRKDSLISKLNRIKVQKGAFLYCNQHFNFSNSSLFDYEKYFSNGAFQNDYTSIDLSGDTTHKTFTVKISQRNSIDTLLESNELDKQINTLIKPIHSKAIRY